MHWKYAEIKSRYLSGAPSVMVELGPGAGANLRYLPRGTRLIAIEPNLKMHALLRRGAKKYGIELDLRGLAGEDLDLPSKSVDFIFSSLVLCSVENPEKVIAEVPETDLKTKQNLQAKLDELAKLDDSSDPTGRSGAACRRPSWSAWAAIRAWTNIR